MSWFLCAKLLWNLQFGVVGLLEMLLCISQTLTEYKYGCHEPNGSGIFDLVWLVCNHTYGCHEPSNPGNCDL